MFYNFLYFLIFSTSVYYFYHKRKKYLFLKLSSGRERWQETWAPAFHCHCQLVTSARALGGHFCDCFHWRQCWPPLLNSCSVPRLLWSSHEQTDAKHLEKALLQRYNYYLPFFLPLTKLNFIKTVKVKLSCLLVYSNIQSPCGQMLEYSFHTIFRNIAKFLSLHSRTGFPLAFSSLAFLTSVLQLYAAPVS